MLSGFLLLSYMSYLYVLYINLLPNMICKFFSPFHGLFSHFFHKQPKVIDSNMIVTLIVTTNFVVKSGDKTGESSG